jgi:uncharacterized protein
MRRVEQINCGIPIFTKLKNEYYFFAGTRDPLCNMEKLREVLHRLPVQYDLEIVKGGDHSFKLPKSSSQSAESVHRQIVEKCLQWLDPITK